MPTYQYVCTDCGDALEVVQKFSDDALTTHEVCGGKLRKVFSPVGIVFKGSGFYRTDSRNGSGASSKASTNGTANSSDKAEKTDKADKSEKSTTPAKSESSTTSTPAASGASGSSSKVALSPAA